MRIGIIGTGQIGATIARQYSRAGHEIKISNSRGGMNAKELAAETRAAIVPLSEVVVDVDVIVISIPQKEVPKLPEGLFRKTPTSTCIIDTCNYYPIRDGIIQEIEDGMPESVWVSKQIQKPVVKVYNSIFAGSLSQSGLPKNSGSRIALPIAGDSKNSKEVASLLVNDSGFDSLQYGPLEDSWRQQPGSPVYCTDLTLDELKRSIQHVNRALLSERREMGLQYILDHGPENWKGAVKYNREVYGNQSAE